MHKGALMLSAFIIGFGGACGVRAGGGGGSVHEPAVQGQFYPAEPEKLRALVEGYMAAPAVEPKLAGRVRAMISPHAGYVYSGSVAGQVLRLVPADTTRVIVLAPSHHVGFAGGSIPGFTAFRNALGEIVLDPEGAKLREKYEFFVDRADAHAKEHSLEVMLPFLQCRLKAFTLIPVVLGQRLDATAMAKALAPLMDDPKTVLVASSDLSHYKPYDTARQLDQDCVNTILKLDSAGLQKRELCGVAPVTVLVELARAKGWTPTLVDYKNSGDTAGDKSRVVGYAGIVFTEPAVAAATAATQATTKPEETPAVKENAKPQTKEPLLPVATQKQVLELARTTIVARLQKKPLPALPAGHELLEKKLGCFVTLHKAGELRGCIGHIFPQKVLVQAVQDLAQAAAFEDPRFRPVQEPEMATIDLEISVLTVPQDLPYKDGDDLLAKLQPNVHGVVLRQGLYRQSTFLPQVWEQIPDKVQFLQHLCLKGGMAADAWKDPKTMTVQTYEAFVFGEKALAAGAK